MEIDTENVNYLISRCRRLENLIQKYKLKIEDKDIIIGVRDERIKELEETADAVSKSVVLETKVRHDVEHEVIELKNANKLAHQRIKELEQQVAKYDFLD